MSKRGAPGAGTGRLVVVTTSYPAYPGDASGHFVASEARALAREGYRVTVLAPRVTERVTERDEPQRSTHDDASTSPGVTVKWLAAGDAFGWPGALTRLREQPSRALGAVRFIRAARRELEAIGALERVVAHFIVPSAFPIAVAASPAALEVVVHGSDLRALEALPWLARRGIARSLAHARIRCVSADLRVRLGAALGADFARRAEVAPSPLELRDAPSRLEARRALGIAVDARLVVIVGRLLASKGTARALGAARLVPGARVVVVGDGPERARLEREFPEARFTGHVARERALAWLAAADALLSASEHEGAPSVVREARALGTHVVAWPAGDLRAWSRADPGLFVPEPAP